MGGCRALFGSKRPRMLKNLWIGILRMRLASRKCLQILSFVSHGHLFGLDSEVAVNSR